MTRTAEVLLEASSREAQHQSSGAALGASIPGSTYLCQVGPEISCGACCGLYNIAGLSEPALKALLGDRTERFSRLPREIDTLTAFGDTEAAASAAGQPFPEFHHCPFVGLIGKAQNRVGCLLHPLGEGNNGVDYRGLSYYGGMACRVYFCPTYHLLAERHKPLVTATAAGWYAYGLVVTEWRYLAALFDLIENRAGRHVSIDDFPEESARRRRLAQLIHLKFNWSWRRSGFTHPAHYFFEDERYARAPVDYGAIGAPPSSFDILFHELGAGFESADEMRRAEALITSAVDNLWQS